MKIRAHKIASVVSRLGFKKDVEVTDQIEARAGSTIVVRALREKRVYRELELDNGRMSSLFKGDVIVGALGRRRALRGFSGDVPVRLRVGDKVDILNRGGVMGTSTSDHKDLGQPLSCEVLGAPVRGGRVVRLEDARIPEVKSLAGLPLPPLVLVSGTCMDCGKTLFLTEVIKGLTKAGLAVAGGKLTGIACLRDLISLEDHGAVATASFLDAGLGSTAVLEAPELQAMARTIVSSLAKPKVDVILLELGDGVIGEYGVLDILKDPEIHERTRLHAFCASDMVGAWGGYRFLQSHGISLDLFSGPVTDSDVGVRYLEREFGRPAINAYRDPEPLAKAVMEHLGIGAPGAPPPLQKDK